MSISLISSSGASPVVNALALSKMANGEYSAGSVIADPASAAKLVLIKLQDGNYGSLLSSLGMSAASNSSFGVQSALNNLVLGG